MKNNWKIKIKKIKLPLIVDKIDYKNNLYWQIKIWEKFSNGFWIQIQCTQMAVSNRIEWIHFDTWREIL